MSAPFAVRDCALVAIATGRRAQTLREFHDALASVPAACVYYHFWGRLLRPRFDDREFHNDFACWAYHALADELLAERLAVIDPADFPDLETLRTEVLEIVEARIGETGVLQARRDRQFHFRRCQTVVFDTGLCLAEPRMLVDTVSSMSLGSIYYHVIDARLRDPVRVDDFRGWLANKTEFDRLVQRLSKVDPYFSSLAELRDEIAGIVRMHFAAVAR